MKSSKALNDKEEKAIGLVAWDIATAMELNGRVPQAYFDSLNTVLKKTFNLPKQTLIDVTLRRIGSREWSVIASVGTNNLLDAVVVLPKKSFVV